MASSWHVHPSIFILTVVRISMTSEGRESAATTVPLRQVLISECAARTTAVINPMGLLLQTTELEDNSKLFEPSDILDEDLQKYVPPSQTETDLESNKKLEPTELINQPQPLTTSKSSKPCSSIASITLHKQSSPGRGIINHYNKCYAIAIIQQLPTIDAFREIVLSAELEDLPQVGPVKVCIKLKQLFQALDDFRNKHPAMIEDFFSAYVEVADGTLVGNKWSVCWTFAALGPSKQTI